MVPSPLPRIPTSHRIEFWIIERMYKPLKNDVNVSGVKSIYMIIIVIMYDERSDLFKKPTTPTPRPLVSIILISKNMNAENEEETRMKC